MVHEVLIIDDEWKTRQNDYLNFAKVVSEEPSNFKIHACFLESPNNLEAELRTKRFSAVIIDAKLEPNWPETNIRKVMQKIGESIPIAIVSSRWNETTQDDINEAFSQSNCNVFLLWEEIEDVNKGGAQRVAAQLINIIYDQQRLVKSLDGIGPSENIRILHISDLQFGSKIVADLDKLALGCADAILENWDIQKPHFLAITGDIVERGLPSEYEMAYNWMRAFVSRLDLGDLPSPRILLVPGNHDYCVPLAVSSRVVTTGSKIFAKLDRSNSEATKCLSSYAFRPYVDFVKRVSDCPWGEAPNWNAQPNLSWIEERFKHLGIIFYGLNSNSPINPQSYSGRMVCAEELKKVQEELLPFKSTAEANMAMIGLLHHNPGNSDYRAADGIENLDDFQSFCRGPVKTTCFLHGHVHKAETSVLKKGKTSLFFSSASTLTLPSSKRSEDTRRGFSLIDLRRESGYVKSVKIRAFTIAEDNSVNLENSEERDVSVDGSPVI